MRSYGVRLLSYSLLMGLIIIISCSKSDPKPSACYLKSASTTGATVYAETMTYNDKMQVISIATSSADTVIATYTYAANGNLATADFGDGNTAVYTFDSQNRITHWELAPNGLTWDYTYNSSGQHLSTTFADPGCGSCGHTSTFAYPNTTTNNYAAEVFASTTNNYTANFLYDDKPNPYKPVLWSSTGTDNNVTKQVIIPAGATITTVFIYKYGDNGYPTSRISSDGNTTAYTYECK